MLFAIAKISATEAKELLTKKKSWLAKEQFGRLELVYLPYYRLDIAIQDDKQVNKIATLCDGIAGVFTLLGDEKLLELRPANAADKYFSFALDPNQAEKIVREELSRMILVQSLQVAKSSPDNLKIENISKFAFPYWVIYFTKRGNYDFRALNAISGGKIGIKLRKAFLHAFTSES